MNINRKTQTLFALAGIVVAGVGAYSGYQALENKIVSQNFVNVVVVKPGHMIEPYTPIIPSDLDYFPMAKNQLMPGVYTDMSEVIGKRTYQKVGELSPVFDWQLTDQKFLPDPTANELQYEFSMYDFAPLTVIRTGDVVGVWVKYNDRQEDEIGADGIRVPKEPTLFKKTNPAADLLFTTVAAGIKDGEGTEVFSLKPPKYSSQVIEKAIEEADTGSDTQDRLRASFRGKPTNTPAKILLNLTPEQVKILEEAKQYGEWTIGVRYSDVTEGGMTK